MIRMEKTSNIFALSLFHRILMVFGKFSVFLSVSLGVYLSIEKDLLLGVSAMGCCLAMSAVATAMVATRAVEPAPEPIVQLS